MKRKITMALLSLFCISVMADEPKTHVVVWGKDGTLVAYALSEKPQVLFRESNLVIKIDEVEVNYALENMERLTYENFTTAISDLQTDREVFKIDGDALLFYALKENSVVSIYTFDGTLFFSKVIHQEGDYSFPLSSLTSGAYIIKVNSLTYKIIKK